ncbi:cutinase family protein [Nocardioides kribbensis]|uniref:Cutinase family protein n=1 Tax=Nocardioides kribbensis TaxID=305517 RepID=A0ABV1NWT3_9ACTN
MSSTHVSRKLLVAVLGVALTALPPLVSPVAAAPVAASHSIGRGTTGPVDETAALGLDPRRGRWPGADTNCPDVRILVARGSGEEPQAPHDPLDVESYTVETDWGLGGPGTQVAGAIQGRANKRQLTSIRQGVVYPAMDVPADPRLFDDYLASIQAGARGIVAAVEEAFEGPDLCAGDGGFHLVGYSQGAWSVRLAVRTLARKYGDPCCHGMPFIGSVTLFGDPTFDAREEIVHWSPARGGLGVAHIGRFAKLVPDSWYAPYSRMVRDRVSSYCLEDDLVCRTPRGWFDLGLKAMALKWTRHLRGHLSYGGDEIVKAGKFASKWFPPGTGAVRAFVQEALDAAHAGDTDALWNMWSPDAEEYLPCDLVDDVGGLPGRVDSCSVIYANCYVWLDADPGQQYSVRIRNTFDDPDALRFESMRPADW